MRALALVTDAYGGRGGVAQAARDVIGTLAVSETISSIIVLPRHVPDAVPDLPSSVTQWSALPGRIAYGAQAAVVSLTHRPDLIFCNHLYMAPLAAAIARLVGAQLIIQLHGIEIWSRPTRSQIWAMEVAALLLCVSRNTRARALDHARCQPERAMVVNNTVASHFFPRDRVTARAKFNLCEEFVLLTVGRIDHQERYKGHDTIIESLPILQSRSSSRLVYVIGGDGNDRHRLELLAQTIGVSDYVLFLGQISAANLPYLYSAADLFCLPSTGEGFGIVFLEAMACGTPAIGLAVGGAPDALGDGDLGVLVPDGSGFPSAVAATMQQDRDPQSLSDAVTERFGEQVFRHRLTQCLATLY